MINEILTLFTTKGVQQRYIETTITTFLDIWTTWWWPWHMTHATFFNRGKPYTCSHGCYNLHSIYCEKLNEQAPGKCHGILLSLSIFQNSFYCCSCWTGFCVELHKWCLSTTLSAGSSFSGAWFCRITGGLSMALWARSLPPFLP